MFAKPTLTEITNSKQVIDILNKSGWAQYLIVAKEETTDISTCEDIIYVQKISTYSILPATGVPFHFACKYNNFRPGLSPFGCDFFKEMLDDLHTQGLKVFWTPEPAVRYNLKQEFRHWINDNKELEEHERNDQEN